MFKNPPRVLAHKSAARDIGSFVTKDRIITSGLKVFNRTCPHKFYPIGKEGYVYLNTVCQLHGYEFDEKGKGVNNSCKLTPVNTSVGDSGLIYENFDEPDHWAFQKIRDEKFVSTETTTGSSTASWLWNHDMEVDILHLRENGIHPWLSSLYSPKDLYLHEGDGWCLQSHRDGFWMLIYPFTFIEWSPGCLGIKTTTPNDINNEWGFTFSTQLYFAKNITWLQRGEFAKLIDVYQEDLEAVEQIKEPYRMVYSKDPLERQNIHFGEWVLANRSR